MITIENEPSILMTSKNPILAELSSTEIDEPNYRVQGQLVIYNADKSVTAVLLGFPINDRVLFDLAPLINAFLDDLTYVLPDLLAIGNVWQNISAGNSCKFQMALLDAFGVPLAEYSDQGSVPFNASIAIRAGFAKPYWADTAKLFDWLSGFTSASYPFLTWKPKVSLIGENQKEYLSYISILTDDSATSSLTLKANIAYTDGTTHLFTTTVNVIYGHTMFQIPVGINQLGLNGPNPSKKILKYTVQVFQSAVIQSEIRTYVVDYQKYIAERYLMFVNSFGAWDTVRFVGKGEFQSEYLRTLADSYSGDYSQLSGTKKSISQKETAGAKINTGFISRAEVHWLRDLFLSPEVRILENGQLVPITLVEKKIILPIENDINSISVEYDNKFSNLVYSPANLTTA